MRPFVKGYAFFRRDFDRVLGPFVNDVHHGSAAGNKEVPAPVGVLVIHPRDNPRRSMFLGNFRPRPVAEGLVAFKVADVLVEDKVFAVKPQRPAMLARHRSGRLAANPAHGLRIDQVHDGLPFCDSIEREMGNQTRGHGLRLVGLRPSLLFPGRVRIFGPLGPLLQFRVQRCDLLVHLCQLLSLLWGRDFDDRRVLGLVAIHGIAVEVIEECK